MFADECSVGINHNKTLAFLYPNRALPWDPNIGEEAGEMDSFVKYLVMRLRNSLVEKSGHYALEPGPLPEVRNILAANSPNPPQASTSDSIVVS